MTSPKFVFYLTCLFLGITAQMNNLKQTMTAHQERGFISANVGDNLTLRCFCDGDAVKYFWYKQTLGQKPRLISVTKKFDKDGTFYDEFKDPRFTLETSVAAGTIVSVKSSGLNIPALVHQSASVTMQPGGSVTLNCTVHTGTCDGEQSVYWLKDSGLIYTYGGRNDSCERNPNTQTHTCVYNLPMKSVNLSHAGTYYCAVASCGHIVFGNGTKLDFEDEADSLVLVYMLSAALTFTTILAVLLTFSICMMNNSCKSTESEARVAASSSANAEGHRDADDLHYAALSVHTANRPRRQRNNTKTECVYASVKQ